MTAETKSYRKLTKQLKNIYEKNKNQQQLDYKTFWKIKPKTFHNQKSRKTKDKRKFH